MPAPTTATDPVIAMTGSANALEPISETSVLQFTSDQVVSIAAGFDWFSSLP